MRACILDERGGTHLRLQWIKIAQTALLSIGIAAVWLHAPTQINLR